MSPLATYLVETFVTLLAVVAIAIFVLVGAKRLGIGKPHGPIVLLGRMPLDPRRVLYLVKVADQVLILGASEAGLTKLGEVKSPEIVQTLEPHSGQSQPSFSELFKRVRSKQHKADHNGNKDNSNA